MVQSTKERVPKWSLTGRAKETPTVVKEKKDLWSAREKPPGGPSPAEYPITRWPPSVTEAKVKIYHPSVAGGSSPTASGKPGGSLTAVAE